MRERRKQRNPPNSNSLSGRREISCLLCAECSLPYLQQSAISSFHQPDSSTPGNLFLCHVTLVVEKRNAYKVRVEKPEGQMAL